MNQKTTYQAFVFPLLLLALVFVFLIDIRIGSTHIPLREFLNELFNPGESSTGKIIWQIRIPRAVTALFVGASLSVSGLLMQSFFRNPIAGPYVLGISSGASLGIAILFFASTLLSGLGLSESILNPFNNWNLVIFGSLGAAFVLFLVLLVSFKIRDSATLLILGLMFGAATSALVTIMEYFSGQEELRRFVLWSFGSLGGTSWGEIAVLSLLLLPALVMTVLLARPLNVLLLGEDYAKSMGLQVWRYRVIIILLTGLLAGSITAFCGPIAFIGIAVPHLARIGLRSNDHVVIIPATILIGMLLLLFCDTISHFPGSGQVLPINAITSMIGAPLVIWIIIRRKRL